jgi:PD-(D/E)XK endonuclease
MMIDSGGMVGELVGGNISVLWAMADERIGRRGVARSRSTAADKSVRPTLGCSPQASSTPGSSAQGFVKGGSTGKRRGELGEAAFLTKVLELGFGVSKTWGDSDRYDFVVDGGSGLWRVQVKSAHRTGEDGGYSFHAHGHSLVAYRGDEIDALVAYVVPENAWYVFPVSVFGRIRSMNLFPASRNKRSKFEKYREAWWILRGEV